MSLSKFVLACGAIGCSALVAPVHADDGIDVRTLPIIRGRVATTGEMHATVAILSAADGESSCTGTLIAPRVVATAAHCVVEQDEQTDAITARLSASDLTVVAGVVDAAEASSGQTYALTSIVIHPNYPNNSGSSHASGAGRYDDVALLILERAVTGLTPAVVPAEADVAARLTSGKPVTVSGYGTTNAAGDGGGVLYIAETTFDVRVDAEIVLGGPGKADTCPGDSGGPAYLLESNRALLVGITSRGSDTAEATCGEGGIYGFAPAYRDWFAANASGLYDPGASPTTPTTPVDTCDPEVEDCEDFCDPDFEDCDEDFDDGCAASGSASGGFAAGLGVMLWLVVRRRRLSPVRASA